MYDSNKRARVFLFEVYNCIEVWFKPHTKRKDRTFTEAFDHYKSTDLFNLFDGIALSPRGVIFFQVKTNAWPKSSELNKFKQNYPNILIISINVKTKDTRIHVSEREYPFKN